MPRHIGSIVVLAVLLVAACREPDLPVEPDTVGAVFVDSDPQGARILVNGEDTDLTTPDTLMDLRAERDTIDVTLDTLGLTYGFQIPVRATSPNEIVEIKGPLLLGCGSVACLTESTGYHQPNAVRFATNPVGALMVVRGDGDGVLWPSGTANSYVSGANAVLAAVEESTGAQVALGPYDYRYLFGRPAPSAETADGRFIFRQTAWVLPAGNFGATTIRGLEVEQSIVADATYDDIVLLRFVFRNITADPLYQVFDPGVPPAGQTYDRAYVGFVLDADVGNGGGEADDDMVSYVPEHEMALIYDSDFRVDEYTADWQDRPGVVGIRVVEAPAETEIRLNAWPAVYSGVGFDWSAGTNTEAAGWQWLSAQQDTPGNHPDAKIGYAPVGQNDYRISVSAGELSLAPGDSAALTVALLLASPVEGEFTSGTVVEPGDPTDGDRTLYRIVGDLLRRSDEAAALLPIDTP